MSKVVQNALFPCPLKSSRRACLRNILSAWLLVPALCCIANAKTILPACPIPKAAVDSHIFARASEPNLDAASARASGKLIVIGFMGGNVRANNLVHREALVAKDLQQHNPLTLHAAMFANRDGHAALETVLGLLDRDKDGCLSDAEKSAARIVIYGHSWGASETITLARRLNELNIPVLLTIQVDSVEKLDEQDGRIPANVRQAINFYQTDGLLHGRRHIEAADPRQTAILGNFESGYKENPVSCAGYPWYARAFMKPHIEIENDPRVWDRIEALIQSKLL